MNTAITQFDPSKFKKESTARDAIIKHGKDLGAEIGDWSVAEEHVDQKLARIQEAVAWWKEAVREKGRPRKNPDGDQDFLSPEEAQKIIGYHASQIYRWDSWLKDEDSREEFRVRLLGPVYRKLFGITHGTQGTGMDEWYTPAKYIEAARKVLGGIELDPASSEIAQETVQAERYFTINDNALAHEWKARSVFMNPPYSTEKIFDFVRKLREALVDARVDAAILLTNALTDTSWFHIAEEIAASICFTRGRIKFIKDGEEGASPTFGQAFFYFGDESEKFAEHFSEFGFIR